MGKGKPKDKEYGDSILFNITEEMTPEALALLNSYSNKTQAIRDALNEKANGDYIHKDKVNLYIQGLLAGLNIKGNNNININKDLGLSSEELSITSINIQESIDENSISEKQQEDTKNSKELINNEKQKEINEHNSFAEKKAERQIDKQKIESGLEEF